MTIRQIQIRQNYIILGRQRKPVNRGTLGFHLNVSFFLSGWVIYSVSDPDSLSPDLDPAL
jgi:hypothetical protein